MQVRTRIAPSPTGIAHLGTAYVALRNYALAKKHSGKFIVRIEDTDQERYVEEAVDAIFDALNWLGLENDEGPRKGGPYSPYIQSEKLDRYKEFAEKLVKQDKAYYCFCSKERLAQVREEQKSKNQLPKYDGRCQNLTQEEIQENLSKDTPHVIRLKVPQKGKTIFKDLVRGDISFDNQGIDDQVLLKSDGFPTYHLAVVVDDHVMKISHIIRGEEWLSSTPKHILLYKAFGWEIPIFAHIPLLRNQDKSKMSKRSGDVAIHIYKDKGYLKEAIINFLALMGWSHPEKKEVFSLEEFIQSFTLDRIQATAPAFDQDKLDWLNGVYIRKLSDEELYNRIQKFIPEACPKKTAKEVIPLIKERLVTLKDFEKLTSFFYTDISHDKEMLLVRKGTPSLVKKQIQTTISELDKIEQNNWSHEKIEQKLRSIADDHEWKLGQYLMMIRAATTGEKATPPLFETLQVLGKNKTVKRLNLAQEKLS